MKLIKTEIDKEEFFDHEGVRYIRESEILVVEDDVEVVIKWLQWSTIVGGSIQNWRYCDDDTSDYLEKTYKEYRKESMALGK